MRKLRSNRCRIVERREEACPGYALKPPAIHATNRPLSSRACFGLCLNMGRLRNQGQCHVVAEKGLAGARIWRAACSCVSRRQIVKKGGNDHVLHKAYSESFSEYELDHGHRLTRKSMASNALAGQSVSMQRLNSYVRFVCWIRPVPSHLRTIRVPSRR
jgi:hypothetical protein